MYCCVVLDVFSRRVVGWSIDSHQATPLVTGALGMAINNRNPGPDQTVIHSDHGSQPRFKGSSQRCRVGRSVGGHQGPLRGFSNRGSCGVGG